VWVRRRRLPGAPDRPACAWPSSTELHVTEPAKKSPRERARALKRTTSRGGEGAGGGPPQRNYARPSWFRAELITYCIAHNGHCVTTQRASRLSTWRGHTEDAGAGGPGLSVPIQREAGACRVLKKPRRSGAWGRQLAFSRSAYPAAAAVRKAGRRRPGSSPKPVPAAVHNLHKAPLKVAWPDQRSTIATVVDHRLWPFSS
jgi:hypothetical protein